MNVGGNIIIALAVLANKILVGFYNQVFAFYKMYIEIPLDLSICFLKSFQMSENRFLFTLQAVFGDD